MIDPMHTDAATALAFRLTTGQTAIAGSLLTSAVAITALVVTARTTDRRERRAATTALRIRQLNEFYAPLRLLLDENARHRERLAPDDPETWHVLDNLSVLRSDPARSAVVEEILAINDDISKILRSKAGLAVSDWPEDFSKFQNHRATLSRTWRGGREPSGSDLKYFPAEFEEHVREGHKRLVEAIDREFPL